VGRSQPSLRFMLRPLVLMSSNFPNLSPPLALLLPWLATFLLDEPTRHWSKVDMFAAFVLQTTWICLPNYQTDRVPATSSQPAPGVTQYRSSVQTVSTSRKSGHTVRSNRSCWPKPSISPLLCRCFIYCTDGSSRTFIAMWEPS